jgi:hypothetical protein
MKKSEEKVAVTIDASAEAAWGVIGAVGGVDKWFAPLIQTCRVEGNKRYCTTEAGPLNEDILEVNHHSRVFRYGIPQQKLIPADNIVGTIRVLESGNGKSTIEWSAVFDVLPEKEGEAKEMFKGAWAMGIQGLEKYIKSKHN